MALQNDYTLTLRPIPIHPDKIFFDENIFPGLAAEYFALSASVISRKVPLAYHCIETISGDKFGILVCVAVFFDATKTARLATLRYRYDPLTVVAQNPIEQAYLYLKSLPDYACAVDC